MIPAQYGVPAARPPRPGAVTAAGYLQFAVFAFALVNTVVSYLTTRSLTDEMIAAAQESGASAREAANFADVLVVAAGAVSICTLLYPGAVAILGIWTLKGVNGVRIATWVMSGLAVLCGLFGLLSNGLTSSFVNAGGTTTEGEVWQGQVDVQSLLPDWYNAYTLATGAVSTGLYIAVIILLVLPAAHEYFRPVPKGLPPEMFLPYEPPAPGTHG